MLQIQTKQSIHINAQTQNLLHDVKDKSSADFIFIIVIHCNCKSLYLF